MAAGRAGVGELGAGDWDELPGVRVPRERQLEHAVHRGADLAVGRDIAAERPRAEPARAHDELADPTGGVEHGVGGLWGEALVVAGVGAQYDLGVGRVEIVPERLHRGAGHRIGARRRVEAREMEVGQGAELRARGEVGLEP